MKTSGNIGGGLDGSIRRYYSLAHGQASCPDENPQTRKLAIARGSGDHGFDVTGSRRLSNGDWSEGLATALMLG